MKRQCGPCTMCCTTMAVLEINKPDWTRCAHLRGSGCGIYKDRPQSCRDFECLWLQSPDGQIPRELRPDKSKAVLSYTASAAGPILIAYIRPEHKGAHKKGPLAEYLQNVCRAIAVIVICGDERTAIGPKAERMVKALVLDRGTGPLVQLQSSITRKLQGET